MRSATKTPRHQGYSEIFCSIPQKNTDNLKQKGTSTQFVKRVRAWLIN